MLEQQTLVHHQCLALVTIGRPNESTVWSSNWGELDGLGL